MLATTNSKGRMTNEEQSLKERQTAVGTVALQSTQIEATSSTTTAAAPKTKSLSKALPPPPRVIKKKQKDQRQMEYSLDKLNLHRVFNRKEEVIPIVNPLLSTEQSVQLQQSVIENYGRMLNEQYINYHALKALAWNGIPSVYRGVVWRIILDYQSTNREQSEEQLKRMRGDYRGQVTMYFEDETVRSGFSKAELNMIRVVETDVPRTQPKYGIFKAPMIQVMLKRILTIWGLRHPACGYVQGINEIATPFILVFLASYTTLDEENSYPIPETLASISEEALMEVEADTYWCLSKVLDKIQDNYTNGQPGIKTSISKISQIIARTDCELSSHLAKEKVEYVQFTFRWILCLLIREFPLNQAFRIFDTYLADDQGFAVFHVYVCAALILKFAKKIKKLKFHDIILFLQSLPTNDWHDIDVEILLAEAFVYMSLYEATHGHIKPQPIDFKWG